MMRLPSKLARNATSGLATVFFALHSAQVAAKKDDPFALPGKDFRVSDLPSPSKSDQPAQIPQSEPADAYVFFADVALNGVALRGIAKIKSVDDELAIESTYAFAKGLIATFPEKDFIPISSIEGVTYDFNWQTYQLNITKDLQSSGANLIDMQQRSRSPVPEANHIPALIVDYDLSVQADRSGLRVNGLIAPRFARGNTVVEASFRASSTRRRVGGKTTRLDSFISHRIPESSTSVTIGDFVSQGPTGSRAVRMGGLRVGTDFSLRPDLITQPLPDFTGTVAVPTGIDVLVNDRRVTSNKVERGEFTVQSIPVPAGRSEVGVVVRDALGRETLLTVPFYSARRILAPGLFEGAINIGAVRRRYGIRSSDYGPSAITAMARKGISSTLTLTSFAEASNGVFNGGIGADVIVANAALFSLTARASHNNDGPIGLRSGHLISAGIESTGAVFSSSLEARKVSRGYTDVATANGDIAPPSLIAANINFDLADVGRLQVSAVQQSRPSRPWLDRSSEKLRLFSASYRKQLWRGAAISLDISRRGNNGRKDFSALAGLSVTLGSRSFAQASYSRTQDRNFFQASFARPAIEQGETGYSASLGLGAIDRIAAAISRQLSFGRLELQAEQANGSSAARFNARGSLLATGGSIFATRSGSGTYVLVDSGKIGGIAVERENRPSGLTNRGGKLLLDRVPAYSPIKIGLDPAKLPTSVIAKSVEAFVAAAPRSVAKVDLQIQRYLPLKFQLTDMRGNMFKPGTRLTALPSRKNYIVGHGSMVEINGSEGDIELKIVNSSGSVCQADIADITAKSSPGPAQLKCFMQSKSFAIRP